jgi:hypothetical protein
MAPPAFSSIEAWVHTDINGSGSYRGGREGLNHCSVSLPAATNPGPMALISGADRVPMGSLCDPDSTRETALSI